MNPVRVPLVVSGTGLAATRLLARSLTPRYGYFAGSAATRAAFAALACVHVLDLAADGKSHLLPQDQRTTLRRC